MVAIIEAVLDGLRYEEATLMEAMLEECPNPALEYSLKRVRKEKAEVEALL